MSWQIQLQGTLDTTIDAELFFIDLFDVPASAIDQLHAEDKRGPSVTSALAPTRTGEPTRSTKQIPTSSRYSATHSINIRPSVTSISPTPSFGVQLSKPAWT